MHVVAVTLDIAPDQWDAFLTAMQTNAAASLRDEPGCHQFDVATNDAHQVFLYELYSDAPAFAAHLETEHFKTFNAQTSAMVTAKTVAQFTRL